MQTYARIGFTGEKSSGWNVDPGESHELGAEAFLIKYFNEHPGHLDEALKFPFVSIDVEEYTNVDAYRYQMSPISKSTLITKLYAHKNLLENLTSDIGSVVRPHGYDLTQSKKFCFYKKI